LHTKVPSDPGAGKSKESQGPKSVAETDHQCTVACEVAAIIQGILDPATLLTTAVDPYLDGEFGGTSCIWRNPDIEV